MTSLKEMAKLTLDELKEAVAGITEQRFNVWWKRVAETDAGTGLYIVLGWGDGFDDIDEAREELTPEEFAEDFPHPELADGTWRVCGKIGFASGTGWITDYEEFPMPYDPVDGDVDDTDGSIDVPSRKMVSCLNSDAKRVWTKWRYKLDEM